MLLGDLNMVTSNIGKYIFFVIFLTCLLSIKEHDECHKFILFITTKWYLQFRAKSRRADVMYNIFHLLRTVGVYLL